MPTTLGAMDRQHAHELLDRLGPSQFDAVARLLEVLIDPGSVPIRDASIDEAPLTKEEELAVAASKEWFESHHGIPPEDVMR